MGGAPSQSRSNEAGWFAPYGAGAQSLVRKLPVFFFRPSHRFGLRVIPHSDIRSVPHRFEERNAEGGDEDVLHGFFAKIVVTGIPLVSSRIHRAQRSFRDVCRLRSRTKGLFQKTIRVHPWSQAGSIQKSTKTFKKDGATAILAPAGNPDSRHIRNKWFRLGLTILLHLFQAKTSRNAERDVGIVDALTCR